MGVFGGTYREGAPFALGNLQGEEFCWHCRNQGLVILDQPDSVPVPMVPCPMCVKGRMVDASSFNRSFWLLNDYRAHSWNGGLDWSSADRLRNTNPVAKRLCAEWDRVVAANGGVRPSMAALERLVAGVAS